MNNTFSAKRFGLLFKKTLLERPVQLLGFTGLILTIILILYFIIKTLFNFWMAQSLSFVWGFAGGACLLASFVFGYFSSNAQGSSYLTLPASHFEKWLCGVLIIGILYPIIFLLFFRAMDAGFVALYHNSLDINSPLYRYQYDAVHLYSFTDRFAIKVYHVSVFFCSIAMLGSLYFNKVSIVKTALIFCAIFFSAFALNWLIAKLLFGSISGAAPFYRVDILIGKQEGSIELPERARQVYDYVSDYFFPIILWSLSYIRLREKEF